MSLAIECGATSSSLLYLGSQKELNVKLKMGPANFKIMSSMELEGLFRNIKVKLGNTRPVLQGGIGMPGIMTDEDKLVVKNVVQKIWPECTTLWVGSDVETAMACLDSEFGLKIIVIGGTGSNCFGTDGKSTVKIGGFGHVLGDRGSSYAIALTALRRSLRELEHSFQYGGEKPCDLQSALPGGLLASLMTHLQIKTIPELATWSTKATKTELAALTEIIIDEFRKGCQTAESSILECITELAEDCAILVGKLSGISSNRSVGCVPIGLTGSLFTMNEDITEMFKKIVVNRMRAESVTLKFFTLHETVHGALKCINNNNNDLKMLKDLKILSGEEEQHGVNNEVYSESQLAEKILPVYLGLPQTECRNEASMNLDTMPITDAIDLMIAEESKIYSEISKQNAGIEVLIEKVSSSLKNGGRLFYVGAGTSGRLGILDATECPPTFRTQPEMVQGIIAGGFSSVSKAKEGAEDSIIDGMDAIKEKFVCDKDVVVGIAASGRTPFVWGAMYQAQLSGAFAAFLTFNVKLSIKIRPDLVLAFDLGPEILTGSTRLKSGSATKCILNMLSTLAMVRMGKCFENLMVDLNPANQKLKQRSLRIVLLMTTNVKNVTEEVAHPILIKNKYDIKSTVLELRQLYS